MTHDPLCPVVKGCVCGEPDDYLCCQCDLIREVRGDQDRKHAAAELTRLGQDMGLIP